MQHRFWLTLVTATTLPQAFDVFGVKSGHWCLILKQLFFIRAHNWDGKNQEDEVEGSNDAVCARKLCGFVRTEKHCGKNRQLLSLNRTGYPQVFNAQLSLCAIATTSVTMVRLCLLSQTELHKGPGYLC